MLRVILSAATVSYSDQAATAAGTQCAVAASAVRGAKKCCCSGVPNPGGDPTYDVQRKDYGGMCARWDAADEKPWCIVEKGACDTDDAFQSGKGHWWAHKPCNGEGLPYVPDRATPSSEGGSLMCPSAAALSISARCGADMMPTSIKGACTWSVHEHASYLPDADLLACYDALPGGDAAWRADGQKLMAEFRDLQNPADCAKPRRKWHLLKLAEFGVGAVLKHFAKMLGNHWAAGIPIMVGNSHWRYTDGKCGEGWSCQLSPFSDKCTIENTAHSAIISVDNMHAMYEWPDLDHVCGPHGKYTFAAGRCACDAGFVQSEIQEPKDKHCMPVARHASDDTTNPMYQAYAAPGEITADGHNCPTRGRVHPLERKWGHLWYSAQVIGFLFNKAPLRKGNEAFAARIGLKAGCIAMHVRHGDSCGATVHHLKRVCHPLSAYVKRAREMIKKYGKRQIFIATDDPHIITATKDFPDLEFKFQTMGREKYDTTALLDGRADMRTSVVSDELFRDMYGMASCDYFVGQMTSNIDRIVLEMIAQRKGHYVPYVSLDAPWCDQTGHFKYQGKKYTC